MCCDCQLHYIVRACRVNTVEPAMKILRTSHIGVFVGAGTPALTVNAVSTVCIM